MSFGFWTDIFITNILLCAVPDQLLHLRIQTGVAAAFLTYIVVGIEVHLRIHDGRWVPDALRAHHLSHHVRPQENFNIFLPIFDWLQGSKNSSFGAGSLQPPKPASSKALPQEAKKTAG